MTVLATSVYGFYDEARELALTATEDQLTGHGPATLLTVYVMRAEFTGEELSTYTPEELVRGAVDLGLVNGDTLREVELGGVTADGDAASARVLGRSSTTLRQLDFQREGDAWKVDLTPLLAAMDELLGQAAAQQDATVKAMVDQVVVNRYGEEVAASLREPLSD
ncbi:hypothetical protein SAMN05421810_11297 [Amycolatopsis arida]|uniref:Uncharacterized protein n=1 Tax=Amycolatopsis arida TaxID=587909 RepID=A0A1I6AGI9_9PSEU|nr:hypothetical protein [Amycolatopsis arida]TDX97718.1 hypothetical protein CLV69_102824 [Amycolatopsis arida]SFQ67723.1 hypothetical protein SAMN05421810_11297 [Amycolatopsis arida]